MLRESVEQTGDKVDIDGLTDPTRTHLEGVPHSDELLKFANTFMDRKNDRAAFVAAREALVAAMGVEAMVDAAGVASNFQRMVRIADSTGIPSDPPMLMMSEDLCEQLGVNNYVSAANNMKLSFFTRLILKFTAIRQFRKTIREYGKNK